MKHNTDIVASIDQQYLNGSQHRVGLSQAMPGSTTLQGCQMDRTLPSLCQCRGNEDYTSVYVALGLIFLIFFVLTVLAEYIFAKMFPKLRAPAESEDTAEKGTATSKTVTIAVAVKMHPLEAAGAEKLPLADSSLPEATDCQWEREGNDD